MTVVDRIDNVTSVVVSYELWQDVLRAYNSPLLDEGVFLYDKAKPYTGIILAMLELFTACGTAAVPRDSHNVLQLEGTGSFPGLLEFESYEECIEYAKDNLADTLRLLDPEDFGLVFKKVQSYETAGNQKIFHQGNDYTSKGLPTEETWRLYFGVASIYEQYPHVVQAWKMWCLDAIQFPSLHSWRLLPKTDSNPGPDEEFLFANGLRIVSQPNVSWVVGGIANANTN